MMGYISPSALARLHNYSYKGVDKYAWLCLFSAAQNFLTALSRQVNSLQICSQSILDLARYTVASMGRPKYREALPSHSR